MCVHMYVRVCYVCAYVCYVCMYVMYVCLYVVYVCMLCCVSKYVFNSEKLSNMYMYVFTFSRLTCQVRRDGHEQVDNNEPERDQRDKIIKLVRTVHSEAQTHYQHIHAEKNLKKKQKQRTNSYVTVYQRKVLQVMPTFFNQQIYEACSKSRTNFLHSMPTGRAGTEQILSSPSSRSSQQTDTYHLAASLDNKLPFIT